MFNPIQFYEFGKKRIITPEILKTSIFAAYKFNDGTDSKSGYNGNVGSGVSFIPSSIGNAANFDAAGNSQIVISSNTNFDFTDASRNDSPFSISFFIKIASINKLHWIVNKRNNTGATDSWQVFVNTNNKISFTLFSNGNASNIGIQSVTSLIQNALYHVTVSYDGSKNVNGMNIYINGVLESPTRSIVGTYTGMPKTTTPITLGRLASVISNEYRLLGQIDELYFFNTLLNQNAINFLQNNYYPFI
jgi:hypothetical protein